MASLPQWLQSYRNGRAALAFDVETPPSYPYSAAARDLSDQLAGALDDLAAIAEAADGDALRNVTSAPNPVGAIRRTPRI